LGEVDSFFMQLGVVNINVVAGEAKAERHV
jgi:hypothetical protein